jgi:predicted glycosyltransferase
MLCVTGSPRPDLFPLPANADYVKLPSITKNGQGEYVPRELGRDLDAIVELRARTLKEVAASFRPDVILIDHSPLGVGGEVLPTLIDQRRSGRDVQVLLGLRDILDAPRRAAAELREPGVQRALSELYDRILVYGQPEIADIAVEYELAESIAEKLRYVGIACCLDEEACRSAQPAFTPVTSERKRILATAGGGGDGLPLLEGAVRGLASAESSTSFEATVVAGPLLAPSDYARLQEVASSSERIRVVRSMRGLGAQLLSSDLVVTMGGYNSVYEALCVGTRVLVLPRVQPRREQITRAQRLSRLGLVRLLTPRHLWQPKLMMESIENCLEQHPPDARALGMRFDGARSAALEILDACGAADPANGAAQPRIA